MVISYFWLRLALVSPIKQIYGIDHRSVHHCLICWYLFTEDLAYVLSFRTVWSELTMQAYFENYDRGTPLGSLKWQIENPTYE